MSAFEEYISFYNFLEWAIQFFCCFIFSGVIFCSGMSPDIVLVSIKYSISKQLPDLKDAEAVQKFFLEEIQLGEELLAQGNSY